MQNCTPGTIREVEGGVKKEEFLDAFNIALVVGGSITVPHLRRAFERMDEALDDATA